MVQPRIAVVYSSTYGHLRTLAESVHAAAKSTGAEVDLLQFPEILSEEVLAKMHAAPKADYPIISPSDLTKYDGFLFGFPTRYGRAPACVSAFFDQTGGLWAQGALVGKFAGIFTSSASQHGGQETTALTTIPFLAHHGIAFVPIGFAASQLSDNTEIVGGSAYGAAAIASGDGSRAVTEKELAVATYQGQSFAKFVGTFVAGKSALAARSVSTEGVAAKAAPTSTAAEATPYEVNEPKETATTAEPVAPTFAAATGATPSTTTAAATPVPAAEKATPTTAAKAQPKKKGGLFSCCGKAEHYD